MASQLNVGVIGLGILGEQYTGFFQDLPATQVVAVADIREEQARACRRPGGCPGIHRLWRAAPAACPRPGRGGHPRPAAPGASHRRARSRRAQHHPGEATCYHGGGRRGDLRGGRAAPGAPLCQLRQPGRGAGYRHPLRDPAGLLGPVVYGEARLDDNITVPTGLWGQRSRACAAGSSTAHFCSATSWISSAGTSARPRWLRSTPSRSPGSWVSRPTSTMPFSPSIPG